MSTKLHVLSIGRLVHVVLFRGPYGRTLSTHRNKRAAKKWCSGRGFTFFWAGKA